MKPWVASWEWDVRTLSLPMLWVWATVRTAGKSRLAVTALQASNMGSVTRSSCTVSATTSSRFAAIKVRSPERATWNTQLLYQGDSGSLNEAR